MAAPFDRTSRNIPGHKKLFQDCAAFQLAVYILACDKLRRRYSDVFCIAQASDQHTTLGHLSEFCRDGMVGEKWVLGNLLPHRAQREPIGWSVLLLIDHRHSKMGATRCAGKILSADRDRWIRNSVEIHSLEQSRSVLLVQTHLHLARGTKDFQKPRRSTASFLKLIRFQQRPFHEGS